MVSKRIVWSSRANYELKEILNFYNKRNGNSNYSIKLLDEVENNLESLSKNELLGRLAANKKTRVLVLKVF
jgi:toxin YoeB